MSAEREASAASGAGLTTFAWLHRNSPMVVSAVFAAGLAYAQLASLKAGLDETRADLRQLYKEFVELRVHGLGVSKDTHLAELAAQREIDRRQDAAIASLRDVARASVAAKTPSEQRR